MRSDVASTSASACDYDARVIGATARRRATTTHARLVAAAWATGALSTAATAMPSATPRSTTTTSATASAPAASAPSVSLDRCVDAAEKAQFARLHGKLVEARDELLACARAECPALVRRDCTDWFSSVDRAMPTVVVSARDETGADLSAVRVVVDDVVVTRALDGHALAIDPGRHVLRVECDDHTSYVVTIVVVESEKDRRVDAVLPRVGVVAVPSASTSVPAIVPAPIAPPPPSHRSVVAPVVFASVGALAFASWGYFGLTSISRYRDLRDQCGDACDPSTVHDLKVRATIADVSLGIGVLAIGAAAWTWLASSPGEPSAQTTRTTTIAVSPTNGGAVGWIVGRF
jgi:hypothetical protein